MVKKKEGLGRLLEIADSKKVYLVSSSILSVISTLAKFMIPVAVYLIIAELVKGGGQVENLNTQYMWKVGWFALFSAVLSGITRYASTMISHIAAFDILYGIRMRLVKHLSELPMGYFTKRSSGEIKRILSEDVEGIELFVAHHIPDMVSAIVLTVVTMAYLFFIDWRMALAAMIPLPLAFYAQTLMFGGKKLRGVMGKYMESLGRMNATIVEYVRGMPVVKVFGQTVETFERYKGDVISFRNMCRWFVDAGTQYNALFLVLISSSLVAILPVGMYILTRTPTYSEFVTVFLMFLILVPGLSIPLYNLMFLGGLMRHVDVGVGMIDGILGEKPISASESLQNFSNHSVEFRDVGFSYEDRKVLENVNFTATPGTVTALVGPSGAGKSTIAQLIPRFWDVPKGQILVGGVNVKDIEVGHLMDEVSFVFQDVFMFSDTVYENIRMGNDKVSKQDVIKAAKAAQCHDLIMDLQNGYDTIIGEGGTYLSGGEQQRIALARAILKDAPIIILDEATAYADPENETKIQMAFSKMIKNKTVIVIAHRLSTITDADQILVVNNGQIMEKGKHVELLNKNGLYKKMWDAHTSAGKWALNTDDTLGAIGGAAL